MYLLWVLDKRGRILLKEPIKGACTRRGDSLRRCPRSVLISSILKPDKESGYENGTVPTNLLAAEFGDGCPAR